MDDNKGMIGLALGSWLVALAGGVFAAALLWALGGWSFLQGAFVGAVVFVIFGAIISWAMTRPLPGPGEVKIDTAPAPTVKASAAAPAATATSKAAAKPEPEKKAPAKKAPAKKATAKKPAPKAAAAAEADQPALFSGGTSDKADDLKKISGVGPKMEERLNELGVYTFEQVAKMKKKDVAWLDERLRFKGRIERDDWIGQAKKLAKEQG